MGFGICICLAFNFIVLLNIKIFFFFFGILTMSNSNNIAKENDNPENTLLRDNSRKKIICRSCLGCYYAGNSLW